MKTHYLILLLGCLFFQFQELYSQTVNKLYIPTTDCAVGTTAYVPVHLNNEEEIVAVQFKLHIPDVVRLSDIGFVLTDRKNDHSLTVKNLGNNTYLVILFSLANTPLRGNSGALLQLPLMIPEDPELVDTEHAFVLSEVVLSKKSGENMMSSIDGGKIKIVHGNRPDITVQNITLTSTEAKPGGQIHVAWTVKNAGNQPTKAGWDEQIYLKDEKGNELYLGQFGNTDLIPASGQISRQADFKLNTYPGIDGKVYAKVKLTPYPDLGELASDAANNGGQSTVFLTIPKILTFSMRNSVAEENTSEMQCYLYRSGSRISEETFTLENTNSQRMNISSTTVTIPSGQSGATFTIHAIDDNKANPDSSVVISASGNSYTKISQTVWIEDNEMPALTITAPEGDRKEGETFTFTIEREWATAWPLTVKLVTDHPKRFQFEQNVVIPANQKSVTANVQAINDDLPDVTVDAVFTATATGFENGTGFVKLLDDDIPNIELVITPTSFSESAGPQAAIATLRRTKVTDNRITIKLTDDSKGALYYPTSSIILEKGVTEYQFAIGVVDNALKDGDRKIKFTAAVYISSCSCSAAGTSAGSVSKELLITDDDGPTLKLTSSQSALIEGKENATILTISRNTSSEAALTVNLSCDKPEEVTFDKTVVIPAGKTSVEVPVSVKENSTTEGNRTITFTVSAEGFSKGVCWAMITDQTLPDAVVSAIKIQATELSAKGSVPVEISIGNKGSVALSPQTKASVYLTNNMQLASSSYKELLGNLYTQSAIAPGQIETFKKTFILPDKTGNYYIIASVNEEQNQKELIYVNNTSESLAVTLKALYRIQVSTDKTVYKPGEAIVMTGQASGGTVSNVPVDLYIINNGYRQTINVTTDAQGIFQYTFKPENWQMGHFSVGACYPGEGLKEEMTGFDLYGLRSATTGAITCEILTDQMYTGEILLSNPSSLRLTNVKTELLSVPENCKVSFEPMATMDGNVTAKLKYTITCSVKSSEVEHIKARISTSEGVKLDLLIYYYCSSVKAELVAESSSVNTTMVKGTSRDYQLKIANKGEGETGKITVSLPNVSWMSLESTKEISSLKKGETSTIVLRFTPTNDMPLNIPVTGIIGINCANGLGLPITYSIEPVSVNTGRLIVDVWDEYTEYTAEAPHVKDARVKIKHPVTNLLLKEGMTNRDGLFIVDDIQEGYYLVEIEAAKHATKEKSILVDPGKENNVMVYLNFQAISYSWEVEETEIKDKYEFATIVRFDTNVPVPVVRVNWPEKFEYKDQVIPLIITNQGLISAHDVTISMPESDGAHFTYLTQNPISEIASGQAVVMYVQMTTVDNYFWNHPIEPGDTPGGTPGGDDNPGGTPGDGDNPGNIPGGGGTPEGGNNPGARYPFCVSISCEESHTHDCAGEDVQTKTTHTYHYGNCSAIGAVTTGGITSNGGCSGCWNGFGGWGGNGAISGNGGSGSGGSPSLVDKDCHKDGTGNPGEGDKPVDECQEAANAAIRTCALGVVSGLNPFEWVEVLIDLYGAYQVGVACRNSIEGSDDFSDQWGCYFGAPSALIGAATKKAPIVGSVLGLIDCGAGLIDEYNICKDYYGRAVAKVNIGSEKIELYRCFSEGSRAYYNVLNSLIGDNMWLNTPIDEMAKCISFLQSNMNDATIIEVPSNYLDYKPMDISKESLDHYIAKWNNTMSLLKDGTLSDETDINVIDMDVIIKNLNEMVNADKKAKQLGYLSFVDLCSVLYSDALNFDEQEESENSVCSSITLQFKQTMTMTRQAFRGTLSVFNGHEMIAMKDVKLNLEVKDEDGNIATTHEFQINNEKLETFGGELNGSWILEAQKTGKVTILFIPTKYAAPTEERQYSFGGTLSYIDPFTDLVVTKDLFPVTMTVKPSPNLNMTYFMQRDIQGDDPLTVNKVEPMIPAEFSLLIHNIGAGDATSVNMVTDQPEIIDNDKGLNISLELLSSQLNGKDQTLALGGSVATPFGTIPAGKTSYAQWWFTNTLLGHFTDYDVKATHITSYDNPDLSLLNEVTIHELIRSINIPKTDLAGFLVNDIVDSEDLPDMIYLSDGTVEKVATTKKGTIASSDTYQYTLTVIPAESGWNYGSISDPTNGRQNLTSILRRSDGAIIDTRNIWQTSCTLRDGKEPLYENRIHFVDKMSTTQEQYQLTFEPGPSVVLEVSSFEGVPLENTVADKPVKEVTVRFNKAIDASTFTSEDLTLVLQGEAQDASLITIRKVDDQTFVLDLTAVTKCDGYYVLTIQAAGLTDTEGYNGDSGKSVNWVQYLAPGSQTLSLSLTTGWNWISVNMDGATNPITFLDPIKDKVDRMQGLLHELTNDPKYGLTGGLKTIVPETSYKLKVNQNSKLDWTGTALTPDQVTIDLNKGWNWISYIPRLESTPSIALSLLRANANDEIKGQNGFAKFNGIKWIGTLGRMAPGEGYMYYANTKQSFKYPMIYNVTKSTASLRTEKQSSHVWTYDVHKYPSNMSIVATLSDEQAKLEPGIYTVGAFVGDECRGIGQYVEDFLFITVYGETGGEKITFKALDPLSGNLWTIKETLQFGETSSGSLSAPFELHLSGIATGLDKIETDLSIYPNPVGRVLYFGGDYQDIKEVTILNIKGIPVMRCRLDGENNMNVSTLPEGVYIVMINMGEMTLCRKIVKVTNM